MFTALDSWYCRNLSIASRQIKQFCIYGSHFLSRNGSVWVILKHSYMFALATWALSIAGVMTGPLDFYALLECIYEPAWTWTYTWNKIPGIKLLRERDADDVSDRSISSRAKPRCLARRNVSQVDSTRMFHFVPVFGEWFRKILTREITFAKIHQSAYFCIILIRCSNLPIT